MLQDIIIVGFGGHGKSVADTIERTEQYNILGYTDVKPVKKGKYPYLGTDDVLLKETEKFGHAKLAMGLGYMGHGNIRERLYQQLTAVGYEFPVIIDPSAIVSRETYIGYGSFVGKGAIINAEVIIGAMCIINSGTIVEHECVIGDGTHLAVGATVCGQVSVGNMGLIGANATINQGVSVGDHTIIGAGAVVVDDIGDRVVAVGIPAKVIKTNE